MSTRFGSLETIDKSVSEYLTYPEARRFLQELGVPIAEATLRRMVSRKRVPFTKLDKRVLFNSARLTAWLQERAVEPNK